MGNDSFWPYLVALPGLLSIFYLMNVGIVTNTPVHYLRRGQRSEAFHLLQQLRIPNQVFLRAFCISPMDNVTDLFYRWH